MRMIGHLDGEEKARVFGDYLFVLGIENQVEVDKGDSWAVWIHNEEHLQKAGSLLKQYQANPNEPRFHATAKSAEEVREQKKREQAAYEARQKTRRHLFRTVTGYGFGPLTFILICLCGVIYGLTQLKYGGSLEAKLPFLISERDIMNAPFWTKVWYRITQGLPEVRRGEVWRLLTPIFMHGDFLHIFFNMLWLLDLGSMVEGRQGTWYFAILVVVFGVFSNLVQYVISGPVFFGMSGVVYGLIGYIWIRGKVDPGSGLLLHPSTVTMAMIWLVIGLTGVLGVANGAHFGGLAIGMAWGYLSSLRHR
jgi:GlpG protein